VSRCRTPAPNPAQLTLTEWAQRWSHKRERWVPHHKLMEPKLYGVEELDYDTSCAYLRTHHYAKNPAPAVARYGLYRSRGGVLKPELVGVITYGEGMGKQVLNAWCGCGPVRDGEEPGALECNRLVLGEDEPYNAESWFATRAQRALIEARPQLGAILSFADPVERKNAAGEVFKPGHIGGIYKALGWSYEGRAKPRTLTVVVATGDVISERTIRKLTGDERGWQYATRQLEQACDLKRWPLESGESFLARCEASGMLAKVKHPGNHAYVWQRDKRRPTQPLKGLPYPVKEG
jgi:hypothetical protein